MLRQHTAISREVLFGSDGTQSNEYPNRPGVRVALETPMETAVSGRSDVQQDLMAVISFGQYVALGVVRGKDKSGGEVSYLSLLNNNPDENEGRARFIRELAEGPVTLGRGDLEEVAGRKGAVPGVHIKQCTIVLRDGILTVIDENSTNGTTVFTNSTQDSARPFKHVQLWSQSSGETEKLIEARKQAKRESNASRLGRFVAGNS